MTGELIRSIQVFCSVRVVAVDPSGQILVSGYEDGTIVLWDLQEGKLICTLKGHTNAVNSIVISSNTTIFLSGSEDGNIKVWDDPRQSLYCGKANNGAAGHRLG